MKEIVDGYWRDALGWTARSGVTVVPQLPGPQGIYVLAIGNRACVAAPSDVDCHGAQLRQVMDPGWWDARLGERVERIVGPSVHHYLDDTRGLPITDVRPIPAAALEPLRESCPPPEWYEGGFGDETAEYFGAVRGGRLVAAANLTWWKGGLTDVGVLTHPRFRGRGLGKAVAATAARQAISRSGVARYRALETNYASRAIARRLGFVEYGGNLAIRLREPT